MKVPSRNKIKPPLLECIAQHSQPIHRRFLYDYLANDYFKLTEEQKELYSSAGNGPIFTKNFDGALSHLVNDGLLERTERAYYRITEEGKLFLAGKKPDLKSSEESDEDGNEKIYEEILENILKKSPYEFEEIMLQLLQRMGYGALIENSGTVTPKSNDGGIDIEIKEDLLGLSLIHIQVKRYKPGNTICRPDIQKFAGALRDRRSNKGIFITTSHFSENANKCAEEYPDARIVLIDGKQLAEYIHSYNLDIN